MLLRITWLLIDQFDSCGVKNESTDWGYDLQNLHRLLLHIMIRWKARTLGFSYELNRAINIAIGMHPYHSIHFTVYYPLVQQYLLTWHSHWLCITAHLFSHGAFCWNGITAKYESTNGGFILLILGKRIACFQRLVFQQNLTLWNC